MKRLLIVMSVAGAWAAPAEAKPLDPKLAGQIDKIFADWRLATHTPGVSYGIVVDGALVHSGGIGVQDTTTGTPVRPDTLFRIASMSKAFTALAVLKLRDEGKIALDAPAERYVPELKSWTYPTSDSPRITVRHLITHTAGFVEDNPWGDRQQVMTEAEFTAFLRRGISFSRAPGVAMEYSNLGYALLGRIIGNVSGIPYQDYIRTRMMQPLGMASTTYDIFSSPTARRAIGYRWQDNRWVREPDMKDGTFGAMGGVETSVDDFARWTSFLLSAWPARDGADAGPVRRSTVRDIVTGANFTRVADRDPRLGPACRQAHSYAMGWIVTEDCDVGRIVSHSGGYPGYGSIVYLLPEKNAAVFAFANRTYGGSGLPAMRAMLALNKAGVFSGRSVPVSAGLATAYDFARAVWRAGNINAAPIGNNVLLDRSAEGWAKLVTELKAEVGECPGTEEIAPLSAMEGTFAWTCTNGRVQGRVQRTPNTTVEIQALSFSAAQP
jgi:CubicO group peptidase (beta-lactamase class C family)